MEAIWNNQVIARSDDTVIVEGNHYFPLQDVDKTFLRASDHHSFCGWKGTASYFDLWVNGERNENAAWTYQEPFDAAQQISGRIAFWNGVSVKSED